MTGITTAQIAAIHATAKAAGLDDGSRRALMLGLTGKTSSKDLTKPEANAVLRKLKEMAPQPVTRRRPSETMHGRWAGVLRALWLSAWNLGITRSKDDKALIAFIERQTGISHPRFLLDPADARKAIEGLKAWLAREAGVKWKGRANATDPAARKLAVIVAQERIMRSIGLHPDLEPLASDLDEVIAHYGEQIRRAQRDNCHDDALRA